MIWCALVVDDLSRPRSPFMAYGRHRVLSLGSGLDPARLEMMPGIRVARSADRFMAVLSGWRDALLSILEVEACCRRVVSRVTWIHSTSKPWPLCCEQEECSAMSNVEDYGIGVGKSVRA
jgi:hypothetical protein